jgi:small conductance mechanosensitive channel
MKYRFDELGIEIPFPHQTIYFGEDKRGLAPAAQVRMKADDRAVARLEAEPKPTSFRVIKDGTGGEEERHD